MRRKVKRETHSRTSLRFCLQADVERQFVSRALVTDGRGDARACRVPRALDAPKHAVGVVVRAALQVEVRLGVGRETHEVAGDGDGRRVVRAEVERRRTVVAELAELLEPADELALALLVLAAHRLGQVAEALVVVEVELQAERESEPSADEQDVRRGGDAPSGCRSRR